MAGMRISLFATLWLLSTSLLAEEQTKQLVPFAYLAEGAPVSSASDVLVGFCGALRNYMSTKAKEYNFKKRPLNSVDDRFGNFAQTLEGKPGIQCGPDSKTRERTRDLIGPGGSFVGEFSIPFARTSTKLLINKVAIDKINSQGKGELNIGVIAAHEGHKSDGCRSDPSIVPNTVVTTSLIGQVFHNATIFECADRDAAKTALSDRVIDAYAGDEIVLHNMHQEWAGPHLNRDDLVIFPPIYQAGFSQEDYVVTFYNLQGSPLIKLINDWIKSPEGKAEAAKLQPSLNDLEQEIKLLMQESDLTREQARRDGVKTQLQDAQTLTERRTMQLALLALIAALMGCIGYILALRKASHSRNPSKSSEKKVSHGRAMLDTGFDEKTQAIASAHTNSNAAIPETQEIPETQKTQKAQERGNISTSDIGESGLNINGAEVKSVDGPVIPPDAKNNHLPQSREIGQIIRYATIEKTQENPPEETISNSDIGKSRLTASDAEVKKVGPALPPEAINDLLLKTQETAQLSGDTAIEKTQTLSAEEKEIERYIGETGPLSDEDAAREDGPANTPIALDNNLPKPNNSLRIKKRDIKVFLLRIVAARKEEDVKEVLEITIHKVRQGLRVMREAYNLKGDSYHEDLKKCMKENFPDQIKTSLLELLQLETLNSKDPKTTATEPIVVSTSAKLEAYLLAEFPEYQAVIQAKAQMEPAAKPET